MSNEKRANKRLELALPITLLDHTGRSENISSRDVYLVVSTDDIEMFSLGKEVNVEITVPVSIMGLPQKTTRLSSKGIIVRKDKKSTKEPVTKLGIALRFNENLKLLPSGL